MSEILNVYKSIANMEIDSIKCRDIDGITLEVRDGSLPLRLLLPSTEGDGEFVAIGTLQKMTWVIKDLCLFAPLTKGSGIKQFSKAMVEYIALYLEAIKVNKSPATHCCSAAYAVQMTPIQWGEKTYWGVDITLTVEEIL